MAYTLDLTKPDNLRGREHGLIRAYSSVYDWVINIPSNQLNSTLIRMELEIRLKKLGCTHLQVIDLPDYIEVNKGV